MDEDVCVLDQVEDLRDLQVGGAQLVETGFDRRRTPRVAKCFAVDAFEEGQFLGEGGAHARRRHAAAAALNDPVGFLRRCAHSSTSAV